MRFIQGQNRAQTHLFPISLDESIDKDNEVRLIDIFVDSLDLTDFGFKVDFIENGRPAYHPGDLLKLYIYGYLNRNRSSRCLEKECHRNIEVIWLLRNLKPDHNTISNFRRDNPAAIKRVFRITVKIARNFDLIGGKLLAGDSTKLRAQNSKKNNFNQKKIDQHLAYIENKLSVYEKAIAKRDGDNKQVIENEIKKQNKRKKQYQDLEKELKETGQTQISTSDPESRQMITRNNITEVAYNVQTSVDSDHNLLIDYKVTNTNDSKAMGNMLLRTKSILQHNRFIMLYDKGYHTGSQFSIADRLGIQTIVAIPSVAAKAPNTIYNVEHFHYNKTEDYYTCPEIQKLTTTGKWHLERTYKFKRYTTKACMSCSVKKQCSKAKYGKAIQRSEYQQLIEINKQRVKQNANYYKQRQAIVEHPYGTLKRQWGFNYIMTKKTIKRATADVGFMLIAYNLRRLINILGENQLIKYLKEILSGFQLKNLLLKLETYILSFLMDKTKYDSYFKTMQVNRQFKHKYKQVNRAF